MAAVELRRVNKTFGEVSVLRDMDLKVKDGEFVVLVGPSGCGKSTTLRIIAGLEMAHRGDVFIGDRRVNELPPKDRDVAVVFQNYALYPHMTVFNNMAFGLRMRGVGIDTIRSSVRETARMLEIEQLLDRRPKELSGGQRQRVALGRAVVRAPAAFLFDEPLSNLDAKLRVQMRAEIKSLHSRLGTTMIYVTHDQVEAMTMGDTIVVLNDGRIMQADTALDLYARPANRFVAGFIGSPSMCFFDGIALGDGRIQLGQNALEIPVQPRLKDSAAGRTVVVGLRPEHMRLGAAGPSALSGSVEMIENMGSDSFVYASTAIGKVVVKTASPVTERPKDQIFVGMDLKHVHVFDHRSGLRIH